jgi:hypothetical protein
MSFRFYTNVISQASKSVATGIFITGLSLVGFGVMIYLLPRLFATLAAAVFFVTGFGCLLTAVKIFLAQRRLNKINTDDPQGYRENVKIHIEEHYRV